jgi:hypothetical protein
MTPTLFFFLGTLTMSTQTLTFTIDQIIKGYVSIAGHAGGISDNLKDKQTISDALDRYLPGDQISVTIGKETHQGTLLWLYQDDPVLLTLEEEAFEED